MIDTPSLFVIVKIISNHTSQKLVKIISNHISGGKKMKPFVYGGLLNVSEDYLSKCFLSYFSFLVFFYLFFTFHFSYFLFFLSVMTALIIQDS